MIEFATLIIELDTPASRLSPKTKQINRRHGLLSFCYQISGKTAFSQVYTRENRGFAKFLSVPLAPEKQILNRFAYGI